MRMVATIALHDLRQLLADRSGLLWTFLMPVVFASFFGVAAGGGGSDPTTAQAYLTVVDEDGGPTAERLVAALASQSLNLHPIAPEAKETTEGKVRTLVIPADFSTRLAARQSVTVRLEKDPDTSAEAALVAQTRILAALGRLTAELAALDAGTPLPDGDLVRLESRYAGAAQVVPSGFAQSIPGQAVFFVMLVALTYGAATLTQERESGMLRRLATTPVARHEIIAGKVAGRLVIAGVQISFFTVAIAVARGVLGLSLSGNLVGVWLVLMVFALAVAPLGVLFGALFRDPDQASNIGVITTLALGGLGGCWWPIEITPDGMRTVARALPTGWAMDALHQLIAFGRGIDAIIFPLLVLLGFGVMFGALASRFLRLD